MWDADKNIHQLLYQQDFENEIFVDAQSVETSSQQTIENLNTSYSAESKPQSQEEDGDS
jgi:hypothetical protein